MNDIHTGRTINTRKNPIADEKTAGAGNNVRASPGMVENEKHELRVAEEAS